MGLWSAPSLSRASGIPTQSENARREQELVQSRLNDEMTGPTEIAESAIHGAVPRPQWGNGLPKAVGLRGWPEVACCTSMRGSGDDRASQTKQPEQRGPGQPTLFGESPICENACADGFSGSDCVSDSFFHNCHR